MTEVGHKSPHIVRFHLHELSGIDKSIEIENRIVVARDRGKEGGSDQNGLE
jgi:hypothetical protein